MITVDSVMSLGSLTTSIQTVPAIPTRIGDSKLFVPRPQSTTQVLIDEEAGRLVLIPNTSRRDAGNYVRGSTRKTRSFVTAHLPARGTVLAEDVQGLRAFGSEDKLQGFAEKVAQKLQELKNDLVATREWLRMGALKGIIYDADGTTVISNLFTEFEVTQKVVNVALNVTTTDVRSKIMDGKRASEKLLGVTMVVKQRGYASASFMDALTAHGNVQKAYANYQAATANLAADVRPGFMFGDVEWIEYNATVGSQQFIADGEAYMFPLVPGLFVEALAPANYTETVNTMGQEYYAKSKALDFDKGYDIEAQTNPFPVCTLPAAVTKLTAQ